MKQETRWRKNFGNYEIAQRPRLRNQFPFDPEKQSQDYKKTVAKPIIITQHVYTEYPYCPQNSVRYWGCNDEQDNHNSSPFKLKNCRCPNLGHLIYTVNLINTYMCTDEGVSLEKSAMLSIIKPYPPSDEVPQGADETHQKVAMHNFPSLPLKLLQLKN